MHVLNENCMPRKKKVYMCNHVTSTCISDTTDILILCGVMAITHKVLLDGTRVQTSTAVQCDSTSRATLLDASFMNGSTP